MASVPTVLITGACGYIGSRLVEKLLGVGIKVIAVDNLAYGQRHIPPMFLGHPNFEFHELDVRRKNYLPLLQKADVVIPLAAIVGAPVCEKNPATAKAVNSDQIYDIVSNLSPEQRLIAPNTNSGYGATDGTSEVTEEDPLSPISVYGKTKCEGESHALSHPNTVVMRLATVFGASPRMRFDLMVNDFTLRLHKIRREFLLSLSPHLVTFGIFEPHFKRNFVHVKDVTGAMLFFITHPYLSGVYNVGLPTANLTKWELAEKICDVLEMPKSVLSVAIGHDPDKRNYIVSNRKLLSEGFTFKNTLEQGIKEVATLCDYYTPGEISKLRNV